MRHSDLTTMGSPFPERQQITCKGALSVSLAMHINTIQVCTQQLRTNQIMKVCNAQKAGSWEG